MKKLLFVLGFSIAAAAASAQKVAQTAVPAPVVKTFEQQFKNPTDVEWEKKTNHYEVEFEINKINHKARIDATGKLLRLDTDIKHTELPEAIQKAISSQYAGYKIKDPEKIDEGGKISYSVELKKESGDKKVRFSPDGKVLSDKAD